MRKWNKNIILFVSAAVFVTVGFFGSFFKDLKKEFLDFKTDLLGGNIYSVFDFKSKLDDLSRESLIYHDELMNLNSAKDNLLGTEIIRKDSSVIIKSDSGKLVKAYRKIKAEEMEKALGQIKKMQSYSREHDTEFLYVAVPTKEYFEQFPMYVHNYFRENYDSFIDYLNKERITYLDISEYMPDSSRDDFYFDTDHHWTPQAGFFATESICKKLNSLYGFAYNESYTDINNFNITTYDDYFLGSYGKKVGTKFTDRGADDFSLIIPKFETDLSEEQSYRKTERHGTFEQTFLYLEKIGPKDHYDGDAYRAYCGGDFKLQIMKNNLNKSGEKVLMIRDSYACVVAPYLALQTSELHIMDLRSFNQNKIDVYDYIEKQKFDYVIVLYSGVFSMENSEHLHTFDVSNDLSVPIITDFPEDVIG